jgi:DNA-directed RNA polymerase specialized sigma24 family protein
LRRYARALTRNRERADDLVQDTLARALIKEQF